MSTCFKQSLVDHTTKQMCRGKFLIQKGSEMCIEKNDIM